MLESYNHVLNACIDSSGFTAFVPHKEEKEFIVTLLNPEIIELEELVKLTNVQQVISYLESVFVKHLESDVMIDFRDSVPDYKDYTISFSREISKYIYIFDELILDHQKLCDIHEVFYALLEYNQNRISDLSKLSNIALSVYLDGESGLMVYNTINKETKTNNIHVSAHLLDIIDNNYVYSVRCSLPFMEYNLETLKKKNPNITMADYEVFVEKAVLDVEEFMNNNHERIDVVLNKLVETIGDDKSKFVKETIIDPFVDTIVFRTKDALSNKEETLEHDKKNIKPLGGGYMNL